jgi:hypothetical protein
MRASLGTSTAPSRHCQVAGVVDVAQQIVGGATELQIGRQRRSTEWPSGTSLDGYDVFDAPPPMRTPPWLSRARPGARPRCG